MSVVVRIYGLNSRHRARSEKGHQQTSRRSFDHFVGGGEQRDCGRLGSLQVDDQIDFYLLLDRQSAKPIWPRRSDPRAAATRRRRLVGIIIAAGMDHN